MASSTATSYASLPSVEASAASLASAEASAHQWNHEVFLSFRGVDTREGITSAIYDGLQNKREIKTFMDNQKIQVGDNISPTLLTAIKESRFAVVVLSRHYADSTWCLEELVTIFKCMKDKNRILPLFYKVDPSDIRYQKGSFGDAFTKHEARHGIEKVKQWKDALRNVADLSGWDSNNSNKYGSDEELVDDIVKLVYSKVLQVRIETSRDFEVFEATKLALDKVLEGLQDDGVAVIGLYGVGGVGKTTLVNHAGAQARANGICNKVIMAVVSQSLDLKQIQVQLADMLALNLRGHTEGGRAVALKETILGENKLLIILDDVWSNVPLPSIGIPNRQELQKCNSKVLFTTRIQKVCQELHSDAKINLTILSHEDSLKLFLKKANMSFHESTEIYSVAREVARNCAGLPVALEAIARSLRDEDLDEWKEAAERGHGSPRHVDPENEKHAFNYIKSCYDYLSTDAKSCLLLCCLFPKDYDIPIQDLFMYGIGKGLFHDSKTLQEARAAADLVVKSLKASRLLLETENKGCVRMHDVIRDVAMSISSSEDGQYIFANSGEDLIEWPRIEAYIKYSAISLMESRIQCLPKELVCFKLIQILSFKGSRTLEFRDIIFQSQNELRVLDLRQVKDWHLSKKLGMLANLRALFITCECPNGKYELSDLGKLGKLELLSMRNSRLNFPEDIRHLSRLRMLDVSRANHDMFPPGVISSLIGLEELYMKFGFIWGRKDNQERTWLQTDVCCEEFIGLRNLNVLEVQIHDVGCLPKVVDFNPQWIKFDITINANRMIGYLAKLPQQESQKSLCLDTTIMNLPDWFHKVVTERTEKLVYYWFRDMKNILVEYSTGRLHGVKYLAVIRYKSSKNAYFSSFKWREFMKAINWEVPVFENLEELHVEEVPCVELCAGELPPGSFCNMKKFIVLDCSNMTNALLSSNLLKRLQSLEELVCRDLHRIKYVFGTDGMEPEQIIFTKLRKIHLTSLPKLIDICNGPPPPHAFFQNLKSLVVIDCPSLKFVFPNRSVVECLVRLEELYVCECPNLEAVIGTSEEANNHDMIEFPELKIVYLVNLDKLISFYGTTQSHNPTINCPKLEQTCYYGNHGPRHFFKKFKTSKKTHKVDDDDYSSTRQRFYEESKTRRLTEIYTQYEQVTDQ